MKKVMPFLIDIAIAALMILAIGIRGLNNWPPLELLIYLVLVGLFLGLRIRNRILRSRR